MSRTPSRSDVEEFLYREAALLDAWQLDDWLALFTDDARYEVPTNQLAADASSGENLFFIADDRFRLGQRVARLNKRSAHAEYPHSRTCHMVTNVLIESVEGDELVVGAAFAVHRFKDENADIYVGRYRYRMVVTDAGLRIRDKRCLLAMDTLRPHGRVSIIL
ncbi:MAG: aromatic-ring-hydroxylating dioxygenase subunit beta [Burkholderiaceae bacterium]